MSEAWHVGWLREGVKQWNKRRKKIKFAPDLSGVKLYDFLPPDFRDSPKTSRYFEGIDLSDANLEGSDLSNLNFANAKFDRANLSHSNLSKTNFQSASFKKSDLSFSNVSGSLFIRANFEGSNLERVDFSNSDLTGAKLFETKIEIGQLGAANSTVAHLDRSQFKKFSDPLITITKNALKIDRKEEPKKVSFDVSYSTNRIAIYERGQLVGYGSDQAEQLSFGICEVTLLPSETPGSIGSKIWKRLSRQSDEDKISNIIELDQDLFLESFRQVFQKMRVPAHPTIFIHGFNNSFEDAVIRAAKIGYGVGLGQGIGLFSWPSSGKGPSTYLQDRDASDASKYDLVKFIELFSESNPFGQINIIAHSMGCRLLMSAVEILVNSNSKSMSAISHVVLAAADLDVRHMRNVPSGWLREVRRSTAYVAEFDVALQASAAVSQYDRVGLVPPVFTLPNIDTVKVDGHDGTALWHGYIATNKALLSDLFYLIKDNVPPSQRHGLKKKEIDGAVYWVLSS